MRRIDIFSEKLDKIFSDKYPTKAQILDAYIKSNPYSHEQVEPYPETVEQVEMFGRNSLAEVQDDINEFLTINRASIHEVTDRKINDSGNSIIVTIFYRELL